VRVRRTITAIIGISALALMSVPVAAEAAAPSGVVSASNWYEGKTGTVKWAIADEFLQQLTDAGATMNFCDAAKLSTVSGVNVATMPVTGNSIIELNGGKGSFDGVTDCLVTISGNGATVEFSRMYFGVTSGNTSYISALFNDEYTGIATGASKKLPKRATANRVSVVSPPVLVDADFADILRAGPVPNMTTEPVNLGLFQLTLKVKKTSRPQNPNNSEG
jgi:hypothetical protein